MWTGIKNLIRNCYGLIRQCLSGLEVVIVYLVISHHIRLCDGGRSHNVSSYFHKFCDDDPTTMLSSFASLLPAACVQARIMQL